MAIILFKNRTVRPLTGNFAVSEAMRQINPDVVAAYPITPQTEIMQIFSSFVSNGYVDSELITAESEHSALSACVGAAVSGARAMTATAGPGLALMWEILGIASGMRAPMVLQLVNRALSAPINIHCDHSDAMGARDQGWIQVFAEDAQEAYDHLIQSVKVAEKVYLPVMSCMDGFIVSHAIDRVSLLADEEVREFVGEYKYPYSMLSKTVTHGAIAMTDSYFEFKHQQRLAMDEVKKAVEEVSKEYKELLESQGNLKDWEIEKRVLKFVEPYKIEDAEIVLVAMGSAAGTIKYVIDKLREEGKKVGLLKIKIFRPFPYEEVSKYLENAKILGILDRAETFGGKGGPLLSEIITALYLKGIHKPIRNFIYGLGGRDFNINHVKEVIDTLERTLKGENTPFLSYINLRKDYLDTLQK